MELFPDIDTAEKIAWDTWGLLSFVAVIVWLRWEGPWEKQNKDEPPKGAEGEEKHKAEDD